MLKVNFKKILIVTATLFAGSFLYAQDGAYSGFTPYSIFGIGDISKPGTAYNRSMGGVGIANRNNRYINYLNPAAVTARDTLSFMSDFGLASTNKYFRQDDLKSGNNTFNINDFVISFPVYKSSAMYFGLAPFSNVGYTFSSTITDPNIIGKTGVVSYTSGGSGNMYDLFGGAGVTLWDRLSLGAQLSYYFGHLEKSTSLSFSNSSYRSIYGGNNLQLSSVTGKFGIQYEIPVGQSANLTLGATYKLSSKMKGYVEDYKYATISSVTDTLSYNSDTLKFRSDKIKMAGEIGVGVALKVRDKFMVEVDYVRSDWSNSNFTNTPGFSNIAQNAAFSTTCAESFRGGIEYTPNRNDIRYYSKRITYRAGGYYDKEYYLVNNNPVKTVGITFGATLPIFRWYNGLTVGVDLGQRGYTTDHMVRERFVNFNIGFNLFDMWFQKVRYE